MHAAQLSHRANRGAAWHQGRAEATSVSATCAVATLDHVVPLARGGAYDPGNLVTACGPCNRLKCDMLPFDFFASHPWAGENFVRYARAVHRALKRGARRAVSLAFAQADLMAA